MRTIQYIIDESDLGCGFMSEPYTHRHRNRHTTRPPKSSLPNRMTGSNSAYTRYTSPPEPLPQSPLAVQSTVPDTKPGGETRPSTATSMPDLEGIFLMYIYNYEIGSEKTHHFAKI